MYRTIDLCAGIGGIRKGFERTRHFYNVLSAENDKYAAKTYEFNFGSNPEGDITEEEFKNTVENTSYDVLCAGFPCQPFSSQGNLKGFDDQIKGTIFFHIVDIIERTRPKVVFLENVQNIVSHDKGRTVRIIVETLEKKLNYKIVGVSYGRNGELIYNKKSFVRNTKDFGLPQNRPRAYFIAFDRELYGDLLEDIENIIPFSLNERLSRNPNLNHTLADILEPQADIHYYMSASYLKTLENHYLRQQERGNGFGYYILNDENHHRIYSNAILATGGSGKERNLIVQVMPEHTEEEERRLRKKGGLNNKNIRIMTPTEWGRLQGFIGYGFINENTGADEFGFPDDIPEGQKYKQFGNSVSISVIETIADFIYNQLNFMNSKYEIVLRNYATKHGYISRKIISETLDVTPERASSIIRSLQNEKKIVAEGTGRNTIYRFR